MFIWTWKDLADFAILDLRGEGSFVHKKQNMHAVHTLSMRIQHLASHGKHFPEIPDSSLCPVSSQAIGTQSYDSTMS